MSPMADMPHDHGVMAAEPPKWVKDLHKLAADIVADQFDIPAEKVPEIIQKFQEVVGTFQMQVQHAASYAADKAANEAAEREVAAARELWEGPGQETAGRDTVITPDPLPDPGDHREVIGSMQIPKPKGKM